MNGRMRDAYDQMTTLLEAIDRDDPTITATLILRLVERGIAGDVLAMTAAHLYGAVDLVGDLTGRGPADVLAMFGVHRTADWPLDDIDQAVNE